jgi:hypothetical protein
LKLKNYLIQWRSPWKANSHWPNQEISYIFQNMKAHYCVHINKSLVFTVSHINPINIFWPYSLWFVLILSSYLQLDLLNGLFLSGFPTNILYAFLISFMCATCCTHLILFYLIILTTFSEQYKVWSLCHKIFCRLLSLHPS